MHKVELDEEEDPSLRKTSRRRSRKRSQSSIDRKRNGAAGGSVAAERQDNFSRAELGSRRLLAEINTRMGKRLEGVKASRIARQRFATEANILRRTALEVFRKNEDGVVLLDHSKLKNFLGALGVELVRLEMELYQNMGVLVKGIMDEDVALKLPSVEDLSSPNSLSKTEMRRSWEKMRRGEETSEKGGCTEERAAPLCQQRNVVCSASLIPATNIATTPRTTPGTPFTTKLVCMHTVQQKMLCQF